MSVEVDIQKRLGGFQLDVRFHAQAGRIGILGASGSGKSMTLKSIAGIETPDQGVIRIAGRTLFDSSTKRNVRPQKRNIGYLFQNYALFPMMTAAENIGAGLKGRRAEKKQRVEQMIGRFRLNGLEDRLPSQLSGGQQQRVALARIMAYQPDVILLDEPFSALDAVLKDQLQREMSQMLSDYEGTVILVSHSRDEIYRFCEELMVLEQGADLIYGRTKDIFENPVYREAARLTGCKNFSKIKIRDSHTVEASDWGIVLHTKKAVPQRASCIGYRAHDFVPVWGERTLNSLKVRVADMAQLPFEHNYYLLPENVDKNPEIICWFVQRDRMPEISRRGMPDYLQVQEEKLMFLEEKSIERCS